MKLCLRPSEIQTPGLNLKSDALTSRSPGQLAQSVARQTLGPGSIPIQGIVCCGLEQVAFPQLIVYSLHITCICSSIVAIIALQSLC